MSDAAPQPALKQSLGPVMLTIYGVGNMLGTGIYALVGKAAGQMGNAVWVAFVVSMVAAALTGLSYASLGSRYPRAGGAAYIVHRAFGFAMLSYVIGLAVMMSGLTSMGTASWAFAGYANQLWTSIPKEAIVVAFILILAGVNFYGIRESAWLNAVCTVIETGGLLFVIAVGARYWGGVNYLDATAPRNPTGDLTPALVLSGAVLTFYSFIGFEDLLNVSEEVRNPRRTFPLALIAALIIATLIYIAVCITAVSVLPPTTLDQSDAPLMAVVGEAAPWVRPGIFTAVTMFAVTNTALLNYIMGSRLAYGMSRQGLLPKFLGRVHAKRRTPHVAIAMLTAIVLALVFIADIQSLAKATSLLLLVSFTVVNLSLARLKLRPTEPPGGFEIPIVIPLCGAILSVILITNKVLEGIRGHDLRPVWIAGAILIFITGLYIAMRPKSVADETE